MGTDYLFDFYEDHRTSLYFYGHKDLCEREPNDIFCQVEPTIGDLQPTSDYIMEMLVAHSHWYKYTSESKDHWKYNYSIHEYLAGDCEDKMMTMIHHMINDGIDRKYIKMAATYNPNKNYHVFALANTSDRGWVRFDYWRNGVRDMGLVNWTMPINNIGVKNWEKEI